MSHALSPDLAVRVRSIVQEAFGPGYWDGFDAYMTEPDQWGKEWRFGGQLGFGGKVYLNGGRLYVGCYAEDETPALRNRIDQTNNLLRAIFKGRAA